MRVLIRITIASPIFVPQDSESRQRICLRATEAPALIGDPRDPSSLCRCRSVRALPLIEKQAATDDSSMLRVARALQGERCGLLIADDFRTRDDNQVLQLAAVESVVRCRGRHSLDLALGYRHATDWWEEEQVASALKRMLLAAHAPGRETLKSVKTLPQLRGWYQLCGAEYIRRIQTD